MVLILLWVSGAPTIFTWTRAPGAYAMQGSPPPANAQMLPLSPSVSRELDDVQYERRRVYRGVPLVDLLRIATPPKTTDTALLHFDNGVVIDLALSDAARLDAFVATEVTAADGHFSANFADVTKPGTLPPDWLPIKFAGNKVVVQTRAHPSIPESARAVFSPWIYASSLTGIEFVDRRAYFAEFVVNDTAARAVPIFATRCHFCHGIHSVGGHYGWDFATPEFMLSVHSDTDLFTHVTKGEGHVPYREMPPLSDMTAADTKAMWQLMRAARDTPLRPYQPLAANK